MNYVIDGIKARSDHIEILGVTRVVSPENRIGDMVGDLDKPRRL